MTLPIGEIVCGDCLDVMKTWPESIDLVVTSPPFNAGKEYEPVGTWKTLKDYRDWLIVRMNALWHCCAPGAWVVCELMDMHVSPEHSHALPGQKEQFNMATGAYLTVGMVKRKWYFKGAVVWDRGRWTNNMAGRMACAPGSPALLIQHSNVLFFRKPGGRKGCYKFPEQPKEWKRLWCRSVWSHVQPCAGNGHPAVMPLSMAQGIVRGWSLPGQIVLDPFAGSGTTCLAAKLEGRKFIGVEKDAEYCDMARKRIAAKSARLF